MSVRWGAIGWLVWVLLPVAGASSTAEISRKEWGAANPLAVRSSEDAERIRSRFTKALVDQGRIRSAAELEENIELTMPPRAVASYLTIHHTGVTLRGATTAEKMRTFQQSMQGGYTVPRGDHVLLAVPGDIPYHFVITRGGEVAIGRELQYAVFSNTTYRSPLTQHITVVLEGDFDNETLEGAQRSSLVALLVRLAREHNLTPASLGHHQAVAVQYTGCPGKEVISQLGRLRGELAEATAR